MGADQFGRNGKAKPGAAMRDRTLECLEQMCARPGRHAGAGVGNLEDGHGALAATHHPDLINRGSGFGAAFERLRGIAYQIEHDAEQLVGIGIDRQPALHRIDPRDHAADAGRPIRAPR